MSTRDTERREAAWRDLDLFPVEQQLAAFDDADAEVAGVVAAAGDALAAVVRAVVARLAAGGRLVYQGAGSAGRIAAQDAAEVAPTFGVDGALVTAVVAGGTAALADPYEGVEDDEAAGVRDLVAAGVTAGDVVVGVSASGSTPYVLAGLGWARERGALTVALVNVADSPLARIADLVVALPTGPEVVAGSTRLRAGTAQKMALNRISTLVMVGLGHTYGNLMIGVRPDNAKLRDRQRRILVEASGATPDEAAAALADAGGDARLALVLLLTGAGTGADTAAASAALAAARGHVREAVRSLTGG